jgi:pescadillo protein
LYVIKTHALKKSFVSIKGIYYQAEIMNQKVTYLIPYKYPANLPIDVDYRVMTTFLDFYIVLMKFVNFKLYSSIGLKYPPTESDMSNYQGYHFEKIAAENNDDDEKYQVDKEFVDKHEQNEHLLFNGLHFYLSTEVPRYSLEYIILANGGTVSLTGVDANITHVITDRENFQQ